MMKSSQEAGDYVEDDLQTPKSPRLHGNTPGTPKIRRMNVGRKTESDHSDNDDMDVEEMNWDKKEESIRTRMAISKEKMRSVIETLSDDQLKRYETFRGSGLQRPIMKRWIQSYLGQQVHQNIIIAMAGIAKVFVGELIESANRVKKEWQVGGAEEPITPSHIREAYRRIGETPGALSTKHFTFNYKTRNI